MFILFSANDAGHQWIYSFELRALHQGGHVDLPSSAVGTLCLNSPWQVYIPPFSFTLPRYFWLPPQAVPYFKDEQRCFVFIYLFLLFSIYYSFVPPSAVRRQAGWADVIELARTVLKPRRSICRSPSRSGLDVLLALERKDHYRKLAWPCIVVLSDFRRKISYFQPNAYVLNVRHTVDHQITGLEFFLRKILVHS